MTVHHVADAALQPLRLGVELARDLVVALLALENDEVLEQSRAVLVERSHLDGPPRPAAGRQKAMAIGHRARTHVLDFARSARAAVRLMLNGTTRPP